MYVFILYFVYIIYIYNIYIYIWQVTVCFCKEDVNTLLPPGIYLGGQTESTSKGVAVKIVITSLSSGG